MLRLPPRTATMDELPPLRRVHFRLWQITWSAVIVLITAWCFTVHVGLGITAAVIAKHVLVAILVAGLDYPDDSPGRGASPA